MCRQSGGILSLAGTVGFSVREMVTRGGWCKATHRLAERDEGERGTHAARRRDLPAQYFCLNIGMI